jgi:tetratricopeptide (TPR) repeat protein
VKEVSQQPLHAAEAGAWADEFAVQQATGGGWAEEFATAGGPAAEWAAQFGADARQRPGGQWAGEFAAAGSPAGAVRTPAYSTAAQGGDAAQSWANEFADVPEEWAREFEEMQRGNPDWALENVWDQVAGEGAALRAAERSQYQFTDPNPYLGRSDALVIGRDLFRRGVLSEAALALEAAVRADGGLCEAWRLLGTVHAENDDDRRAIAAMMKANEADPTDLEVLLSLGVSHTNELDQEEATGYMRGWLRNQPRFAALEAEYAAAAGPATADTPASVLALFKRAAAAAPMDADVHAVLGVLAHLSRDYDEAIAAFNTALDINPQVGGTGGRRKRRDTRATTRTHLHSYSFAQFLFCQRLRRWRHRLRCLSLWPCLHETHDAEMLSVIPILAVGLQLVEQAGRHAGQQREVGAWRHIRLTNKVESASVSVATSDHATIKRNNSSSTLCSTMSNAHTYEHP